MRLTRRITYRFSNYLQIACKTIHFNNIRVAQRKRGGPITHRSQDQNLALIIEGFQANSVILPAKLTPAHTRARCILLSRANPCINKYYASLYLAKQLSLVNHHHAR
uniref:Uncharacterized protein n=1 Tax=Oryza nivara TaxID=4536 RepID=A0A0E0GCM2_ORYNI